MTFLASDLSSIKHDRQEIVGTLALGNTDGEENFVSQLFNAGLISKKIATLLFSPWDKTATPTKSAIDFGNWDEEQVVGGRKAMAALLNAGQNSWALEVDDMFFNDKRITTNDELMKAEIDTTTYTIQVPSEVFDTYKNYILKDVELPSGYRFKPQVMHGHEVIAI